MKTIGGYRVVRLLGKGGMAEVYEVEHSTLGVRRAMKVFVAKGERTEFLTSRFLAEGRLLARLDHILAARNRHRTTAISTISSSSRNEDC